MRWASSTMTRSQWTCRRPGRMSSRLARSRDVMTCFCSSHWLTPNWSRMSPPLRTRNFSSNFSLSSRCHWKARLAGQTIRIRSARPRSFSSRMSKPGHDGLAGPGVVGQQEPDPGQLQQVVVDGLQLVRQRVDAGDGEAEVGIELVGDARANRPAGRGGAGSRLRYR